MGWGEVEVWHKIVMLGLTEKGTFGQRFARGGEVSEWMTRTQEFWAEGAARAKALSWDGRKGSGKGQAGGEELQRELETSRGVCGGPAATAGETCQP